MFSYFQHPDWGTRSLLAVFSLSSAFLSAYCGWSLAANSGLAVQLFFSLFIGCIPLAMGVACLRSSRYYAAREKGGFQRNFLLVLILIPLNLLTDYGASSVIRDQTNVASANTNTKQTDLRDSLKRKRKELATLKKERAWHDTGILSPKAYDARILALKNETENGRNIWKRSKECTNTTVASSQRVCQAIATALANKSIAQRRMELLPEIQNRESEISQLEKQFKSDGGFTSNPAIAQIKKMVAWATFSLDHSKAQISWGENGLMLVTTIALTAAISFFGWEIGQRRGALEKAPERWARNWQLEDDRGDYGADGRPVDLSTTPQAGRESYIRETHHTVRKSNAGLAMQRALARWEESEAAT
jgi:hypothetical protein